MRALTKGILLLTALTIAACVLPFVWGYLCLVILIPDYQPGNFRDIAKLIAISRGADPIIAELAYYHRAHGHYPDEQEALRIFSVWNGFRYCRTADGYGLVYRVTHDAGLRYEVRKEHRGHWVFDPGDGTPPWPF